MKNIFFALPGKMTATFEGITRDLNPEEILLLQAYIPGIKFLLKEPDHIDITLTFSSTEKTTVHNAHHVTLNARTESAIPYDAYHLFYSMVREALLDRHLYPIHAACVFKNGMDGTLIVGHSGTGKTTSTLRLHQNLGWKIFSGNKTVISFEDAVPRALAGTSTITIRESEKEKHKKDDTNSVIYGDRLAFSLPRKHQEQFSLPIKSIVLIRLNDTKEEKEALSSLGALHALFPYFLDTVKADTVLDQGNVVFSGSASLETKTFLASTLSKALEDVPVRAIEGSLAFICAQINTL